MRILFALLALPLFTLSAQAQTTSKEPTHKRLTMDQHFQQANVTHDGHLTEEQAQSRLQIDCQAFRGDRQGQEGLRHRGRHPRLQQDAAHAAPASQPTAHTEGERSAGRVGPHERGHSRCHGGVDLGLRRWRQPERRPQIQAALSNPMN